MHVEPYSGDMLPIVARFSSGTRADAVAVELDELPDDAVRAQHLGDGEHEVGRGRADGQRADELDADDAWQQHRQRLAEHRGFGFDAADAPAEHAEAVHHRRVRVGADERVGVREPVAVAEHDLREVLEVHLVADAAVRREHPQRPERRLRPAQERVALAVARELELRVARERVGHAGDVGDDRVVDDEVDGNAGLDQRADRRRASTIASRIAARSTIAGTPVKSCMSTRAGMNCSSR